MKRKKQKIISKILMLMSLLVLIPVQSFAQEDNEIASTNEATDMSSLVEAGYFSERDFTTDYDETQATTIALNQSEATITNGSDGGSATYADSTVSIASEGTYIISGEANDIQIKVEADDTAKVQLVLDNVVMTASNRPVILVESGDKVFITLAENSTNSLTDDAARTDESLDAVIFSRSDLTFNGMGSLTINGQFHNGIESKDDVRMTSGIYNIEAVNTAIKANDAVNIVDASVSLTAGNDGIHISNDEDTTLGNAYINTTLLEISAQSDGIDASNQLEVAGGVVNVLTSLEGIEAKDISITGGEITINSSDDGLNATNGNSGEMMMPQPGEQMTEVDTSELPTLRIDGGEITINAEGDGLDSNGIILINGGTTIVNGPVTSQNGAIDAESGVTITGGTVLALDGGMMSQGFGMESTQASNTTNVSAAEGQILTMTDTQGNVIFETTLSKAFGNIVFSSSDIIEGETYTVSVDGNSVEVVASMGSDNMMPGPGGMMEGMNRPGNMTPPDFEDFNE